MFAVGLCLFVLAYLIDQPRVQRNSKLPAGAPRSEVPLLLAGAGCAGIVCMAASLLVVLWRTLP